MQPPMEPDVERRLGALARLGVLDLLPPEAFQRITRLAAYLAGGEDTTIAAVVHLLDASFQHRIAAVNSSRQAYALDESLCRRVLELDRTVYTEDAASDERLADSPWTSGEEPLRLYVGIPLRMADGTAVGTLCLMDTREHRLSGTQRAMLDDLAAQASAQLDLVALTHELGHDASHDPLTGLANRVLLSQRLNLALARRTPAAVSPGLLLIDLDRFKDINDSYGHAVGDEVLVSTARRLSAAVRPEDVVARLGGDEFAVLVDELPGPEALDELVHRIRSTTELPHDTVVGPLVCTLTVGVARAEEGDLPYTLLGRADDDLYLQKRPPA